VGLNGFGRKRNRKQKGFAMFDWFEGIWAWILTPLGLFVAWVAITNWPWHF
jgi:hypothetical protein